VPFIDPGYGLKSVTLIQTFTPVSVSVKVLPVCASKIVTDISGSNMQPGMLTLLDTDPLPLGAGAGNDIKRNISKVGEL